MVHSNFVPWYLLTNKYFIDSYNIPWYILSFLIMKLKSTMVQNTKYQDSLQTRLQRGCNGLSFEWTCDQRLA